MGVYRIVNAATGRCYVGSSRDCPRRMAQHVRDLRAGRHANHELQKAWVLDGESTFRFTVVEEVACLEDLRSIEQRHLNASLDVAYNVMRHTTWCSIERSQDVRAKIAKSKSGYKRTALDRQKQSVARKGRPWSAAKWRAHAGRPIFSPVKPPDFSTKVSDGVRAYYRSQDPLVIENRARRNKAVSRGVFAYYAAMREAVNDPFCLKEPM